MEKVSNNIMSSEYDNKRDLLVNNLFIHQPKSPYVSSAKTEKNIAAVSKGLLDNSNKYKQGIETKEVIKNIRSKEQKQIIKLYDYYYSRVVSDGKIKDLKKFVDLQTFKKYNFFRQVYELNKIYSDYSVSYRFFNKHNDGDNGYFNYEKYTKSNRDTSEKLLNDFINCFSANDTKLIRNSRSDKITKQDLSNFSNSKEVFEKIRNDFNIFLKNLEENERSALQSGDYELASLYNFYSEYFVSRGLSLIAELTKKSSDSLKSSYAQTMEIFMKDNKNTLMEDRIKSSNLQHRHYSLDKLEGSFYATIEKASKGGFAMEYITKYLNDEEFKINFNGKKSNIKSTIVGTNLNINSKQGKIDVHVSFGTKKMNNNNNNNNSLLKQNTNDIGLSLKNYQPGSPVTVHSGGNLDSLIAFLKNYGKNNINNNELEKYIKILNTALFQYLLLNESWQTRRNNSELIKNFKESLGNFGFVFTLTPFLTSNGDSLIDEVVDFFVINQKIIPGSYFLEAINDSIDKAEKYSATISYPSFFSDMRYTKLKDESGKVVKKIATGKTKKAAEKDNGLYEENYVKGLSAYNKQILNKYSFTMHITRNFREQLEKMVTNFS